MRRRTKKRLYGLALVVGLMVVGVNGAVRIFGGGAPSLFSVFSMKDKVRALSALAAHLPQHVLQDTCDASPQARLRSAARRHGVSPRLVLAMARTESDLDSHAISHAGAMGVLQLMPDTAAHMKVADPFDPKQSADGGVRYLSWLLKRYQGDERRAVAAYNAGPYAVPKKGVLRLPAETRAYVKKVFARRGPDRPRAKATSRRGRGS